MNIEDISNEDFDHWVKQKMEAEEAPFDPVAFERFQKKMPQNNFNYKKMAGYAGSALLLALLCWIFWPKDSLNESAVLRETIPTKLENQQNATRSISTAKTSKIDQTNTKNKNLDANSEIKKGGTYITEKAQSTSFKKRTFENESEKLKNYSLSSLNGHIQKVNQLLSNEDTETNMRAADTFQEPPSNKIEQTLNTSSIVKSELASDQSSKVILASREISPTNVKNLAYFLNKETVNSPIEPVKRQTTDLFKPGLYISAGFSPDLSLVFGNKINGIGRNAAINLEYRFGDRLSISGGYIKSVKKYSALADQYTWIWKQPNTPLKQVTARCSMVDFPINLRYDISQGQNIRLFGTVGTTSYQMTNEEYEYNYEDNSDPTIKWHKWEGKSGSYPLSMMNASLGFEHLIDKNLSFTVEPFAKMPISKVGFGKVNLASFGVFVSAKKRLIRSNR